MKLINILFVFFACSMMAINAQEKMYIYNNGVKIGEYLVEDVDSITFEIPEDNIQPGVDINAPIIGTWTLTGADMSVKVGDQDFVDYMAEVFMQQMGMTKEAAKALVEEMMQGDNGFADSMPKTGTLELKEDGTYAALFDTRDTDSGTWSINSTKTKLTLNSTDEEQETMVFDVRTLNDSQLSIKLDQTQKADMDDDGVEETTLDLTMLMNYTK